MKKLEKNFLTIIILTIFFISNLFPTALAVYDNIILNNITNEVTDSNNIIMENDIIVDNQNEITNKDTTALTENNIAIENIVEENNIVEQEEIIDNFKVLLAGILRPQNVSLNYSNIKEIIETNNEINNFSGIWISKDSREFIVKFLNSMCNENYKVNNEGFLILDKENVKLNEEKNPKYDFYTSKVNELIQKDKCTVFSIEEHYYNLNSYDNEILEMIIEDDEYALIFKNEDVLSNISDIVILNSRIFNNEEDIDEILNLETPITNTDKMNKLLEVFYYDNDEFKNFISNLENESVENLPEESEENNQEEILDEPLDTPINLEDNNGSELKLFDVVLSDLLYSSEDITIENIKAINEIKPCEYGIWVEKNSRNIFLKFLNEHGIYTYSIDERGYLVCDNIMKDNINLDFKDVTEVDIEIAEILSNNVTLYVKIDNKYLNNEEYGIISYTDLNDEEYVKTFDNEKCDSRIIILNSKYFNENFEFDLAISDRFVKKIFNYGNEIELYSDTSKYGYMMESRNVYFGPSSTDYAKVGSVDNNEKIYLLGQSAGWFHIQYHVGSTGTQKSGYVPTSTVHNIVANPPVHEEILTGGHRYANSKITIYSCDDLSIAVSVGTVFEGEGVTILYNYAYSGSNGSYNISFVEYSTSSGTKRGYTYSSNLVAPTYITTIARVTATSSAYSGPDSSYIKLGGAYYNEYVAILAKNGEWCFAEYNTTSGRKRGYMKMAYLSESNPSNSMKNFVSNKGLKKTTIELPVYGGPNSNYAKIGTIYSQEVVSLLENERDYAYIEYTTPNGAKRGYVVSSNLVNADPVTLPMFGNYANCSKQIYGNSGLGQELIYYKIGNGKNVMFAIFAQHGWEDSWASDGIELAKLAKNLIENFNSQGISSDWTLYVIPYANPDGITNGYTNSGPGRCTVTTEIDMNRSWPANFSPSYTARNYTGENALGSPEGNYLKNFLLSNESEKGTTILLDIHGWLNKTYGSSDVGKYFNQQFNNSHNSTYGPGYLETWGAQQGYKSCLIELPKPTSSNSIISDNYSGKITTAILNMINGLSIPEYSDADGVAVNENVTVNVSPTLNVRKMPTTSSNIIATLNYGTTVTRIIRSVTTANGYIWDKIKLSDGTEGYVATNYLTLIVYDVPNEVLINKSDELFSFTRTTDWEHIDILPTAYSGIVSGEEEYNSMTIWERIFASDRLLNLNLTYSAGAVAVKENYPDASSALIYFLNSVELGQTTNQYSYENKLIHPNYTGYYKDDHTMREISVSKMVDENINANNDFKKYLDSIVEAAEKYCLNEGEQIEFFNTKEFSGAATRAGGLNWFMAVNNYRIKVKAMVTRHNDTYNMSLTYGMIDYYDWETPDEQNYDKLFDSGVIGTVVKIAPGDLKEMNRIGYSRNYTNFGTCIYKVTWNKGQRVDSGVKFSL